MNFYEIIDFTKRIYHFYKIIGFTERIYEHGRNTKEHEGTRMEHGRNTKEHEWNTDYQKDCYF